MTDPIPRSIRDAGSHVLETLLRIAAEDVELRRSLATVNAWLARELNQRAAAGRATESAAREGRDVLTPRSSPASMPAAPVDLERVARRATWKAEALRLAVDRRAPAPEGTAAAHEQELRRREAELRQRHTEAGAPWAWMLDAPPARVEEPALALLAEVYDNVAHVGRGLQELEAADALSSAPPIELLRLVAESQSALLVALSAVGIRQDEDQRDLFQWLRDRTTRHRIYVDRHMRLGDPADPARNVDLRERFDESVQRAQRLGLGRKERAQLLNKVRYHVRKLLDAGAAAGPGMLESEWSSLGGAVARWRDEGLDLADRELRDLLGALTEERLPELEKLETPEALQVALAREPAEERSDALQAMAPLLAGSRALMVAEVEDDAARTALVEALEFERLDWLALGEDEGRMDRIDAALAEGALDLVYMGIRLPQEEYLAFKERCVERELPFVRLPGTFEPRTVAHQTQRQVGWRLREAASE